MYFHHFGNKIRISCKPKIFFVKFLLNLLSQVAVNKIDGQIENVGSQLELVVDFDEPIDQNGAHFLVDVGLDWHVIRIGEVLDFDLLDPLEDIAAVFRNVKFVILVLGINLEDLTLACGTRGRGASLTLGVKVRLGAATAQLGAREDARLVGLGGDDGLLGDAGRAGGDVGIGGGERDTLGRDRSFVELSGREGVRLAALNLVGKVAHVGEGRASVHSLKSHD